MGKSVPLEVTDKAEHNVLILLAMYCMMPYINADRYVPGHEALSLQRERNVCRNVGLYKVHSSDGPDDFQSQQVRAVRA